MEITIYLRVFAGALICCFAGVHLGTAAEQLTANELVNEFRKTTDLYSDPRTLAVAQKFIKEAPSWDENRLGEEYEAMWAAINKENKEILKAAFLGTATSLFVLNPRGSVLARSHVAALVGTLLKVGPQGQLAVAEGLARIEFVTLPESVIAQLIVSIPRVEPAAASYLVTLATGVQQDRPELAKIVRLAWSQSQVPLAGTDVSRPIYILQGFVRSLESNGVRSDFAVEILESILNGQQSPLSDVALTILRRAITAGSPEVKRALNIWRNSPNDKLRDLAERSSVRK